MDPVSWFIGFLCGAGVVMLYTLWLLGWASKNRKIFELSKIQRIE